MDSRNGSCSGTSHQHVQIATATEALDRTSDDANLEADTTSQPSDPQLEAPRERRQRTKWAPDEVTALLKGVEKHGVSKWSEILADPDLQFASSRKPVDLKDKWRVMTTRRKPVPNLPSAADISSWSPLMTMRHAKQSSANPTTGPTAIPTTTALTPPMIFQTQQRKRPRDVSSVNSSPPRPPLTLAVNRGPTLPPDSRVSLGRQQTGPNARERTPYSISVPDSGFTEQPPPAPPPSMPPGQHPLVVDLLPPDLMLESMWDQEHAQRNRKPDVAMEDTDSLVSLLAPWSTASTNSSTQFLPPSPSATPVTSPSPPPSQPLLVSPAPTVADSNASHRGRSLARAHPNPNDNAPDPPDSPRDFFNSRYHPRVDYRIPPPPKSVLEWENVMRVRSVSPESRNRFAGVPRSPGVHPSTNQSDPGSSSSSVTLSSSAPSNDQPSFDMSEMLQAVMCLDLSTRSQVFHILSSREFANSPHKQAVAAKFALRPQDMVPVDSPREEAKKTMSVDGDEGRLTKEMRAVLESGMREVLRLAKCKQEAGQEGDIT